MGMSEKEDVAGDEGQGLTRRLVGSITLWRTHRPFVDTRSSNRSTKKEDLQSTLVKHPYKT